MNASIEIKTSEAFGRELNARYIIADTIEDRRLAHVVEEGSGQGSLFIFVELRVDMDTFIREIEALIQNLGLPKAEVKFET